MKSHSKTFPPRIKRIGFCTLFPQLMDANDPHPLSLLVSGMIRRTCQARGNRWSG
jgi:hypothetical protein